MKSVSPPTRRSRPATHTTRQRATERYAAIGRPEDVAERIAALRDAGLRHVIVDHTGPLADREDQLEAFAKSVRPLLQGTP